LRLDAAEARGTPFVANGKHATYPARGADQLYQHQLALEVADHYGWPALIPEHDVRIELPDNRQPSAKRHVGLVRGLDAADFSSAL